MEKKKRWTCREPKIVAGDSELTFSHKLTKSVGTYGSFPFGNKQTKPENYLNYSPQQRIKGWHWDVSWHTLKTRGISRISQVL